MTPTFSDTTLIRKAVLRAVIGFPLGLAVGYATTILISLLNGNGRYAPFMPGLAEGFGTEIAAIVFQAVMLGALGAIWGAATVIWDFDDWGLAKQTGILFGILSLTLLPVAYLMHWMDRSLFGFLIYFGAFVLFFIVVWFVRYRVWRKEIQDMNEGITKKG